MSINPDVDVFQLLRDTPKVERDHLAEQVIGELLGIFSDYENPALTLARSG